MTIRAPGTRSSWAAIAGVSPSTHRSGAHSARTTFWSRCISSSVVERERVERRDQDGEEKCAAAGEAGDPPARRGEACAGDRVGDREAWHDDEGIRVPRPPVRIHGADATLGRAARAWCSGNTSSLPSSDGGSIPLARFRPVRSLDLLDAGYRAPRPSRRSVSRPRMARVLDSAYDGRAHPPRVRGGLAARSPRSSSVCSCSRSRSSSSSSRSSGSRPGTCSTRGSPSTRRSRSARRTSASASSSSRLPGRSARRSASAPSRTSSSSAASSSR